MAVFFMARELPFVKDKLSNYFFGIIHSDKEERFLTIVVDLKIHFMAVVFFRIVG